MSGFVTTLERAIDKAAALPEADQEQLGKQLLRYIETLEQLRCEIDKGIASLDRGEGKALDIEEFLRVQNERHDRS